MNDSDRCQPTIRLDEYNRQVEPTDRLPKHDLRPVLFGLFGEVGSAMTVAKKYYRESEAFSGYMRAVREEFGDILWYFAALCRRLSVSVDEVFGRTLDSDRYSIAVAATDLSAGPVAQVGIASSNPELAATLLRLGAATCALLEVSQDDRNHRTELASFAELYIEALLGARMSFATVVHDNIAKVRGRFLEPDISTLPTFDSDFPEEERLPMNFEIDIVQRKSGRSYMRWNGVFIGAPLTDNIRDPDGYRFHDVFHFAHAAILHWSPTFRGLIKQKRKSDPKVDEAEDGGRAIVVEEGLAAYIFACAKELNFFQGQSGVSFDLLKTVQRFVAGYEVEKCPLRLWEIAILRGYEVFRLVRANNGGKVIGDRSARTIKYMPSPGGGT